MMTSFCFSAFHFVVIYFIQCLKHVQRRLKKHNLIGANFPVAHDLCKAHETRSTGRDFECEVGDCLILLLLHLNMLLAAVSFYHVYNFVPFASAQSVSPCFLLSTDKFDCSFSQSVYGVLNSIEGCQAFEEAKEHTNIGDWYKSMQIAVKSHYGAQAISGTQTFSRD